MTMAYRLLLIPLLLIFYGCASTVTVTLNSIADPGLAGQGKYYVITSGIDETGEEDLFFREFSRYFEVALNDAGYIKIDDIDKADMQIAFKYGISDGQTGVYSFTSPLYDFVGGETITITEKTSDPNGQKVTTINIPARFQRVGTSVETRGYTLYNRTASLEARTINKQSKDEKGAVIWSMYIYSVGESNDLRLIMPFMAAAAAPYLGKNSGQQLSRDLKHDDPAVARIKQQALQP